MRRDGFFEEGNGVDNQRTLGLAQFLADVVKNVADNVPVLGQLERPDIGLQGIHEGCTLAPQVGRALAFTGLRKNDNGGQPDFSTPAGPLDTAAGSLRRTLPLPGSEAGKGQRQDDC